MDLYNLFQGPSFYTVAGVAVLASLFVSMILCSVFRVNANMCVRCDNAKAMKGSGVCVTCKQEMRENTRIAMLFTKDR